MDKTTPEKSEKEKIQSEQSIFEGVLAYAVSLIAYCLQDYLGYELIGRYKSFSGTHLFYPSLHFNVDVNGIINIALGQQRLRLIVIGNKPQEPDVVSKILAQQNSYLVCFSEHEKTENYRINYINPLDPDSCERIGSILMRHLVKDYLNNINVETKFPQLLKEYVNHFPKQYLDFDLSKYIYKFVSFPKKEINADDVKLQIENDEKFKAIRSRIDKDNIIKGIFDLSNQINQNSEVLKRKYFSCISCGESLSPHSVQSFDYLICQNCHTLLDSTNAKMTVLKNLNPKYENLAESDWGMDYLCFNYEEL